MLYFKEIFERSFNLFDDPDISRKYYLDPVGFAQDMRDFLINGKDKFNYPTAVTDKLVVMDSPVGELITIDGEGTDVYTLESKPAANSSFTYRIGKDLVHGSYDPDSNTVTFPRVINIGETCSVAWFYAGAFSADFSDCLRPDFPMDAIMEKVINILAYALLSAYGDKEVGRVLEVRNILTDTDFDMYSPANSAKAKMEWRDKMNANMDTLVVDLNWRIMAQPRGGSRFGR